MAPNDSKKPQTKKAVSQQLKLATAAKEQQWQAKCSRLWLQILCTSICVFLAISVFCTVGLVYLTVIIYVPNHRELGFRALDLPVMCTTTEKRHILSNVEECKSSSCSEWCLSKGSAECTQLYASVRNNGSNVALVGCELSPTITTCPSVEIDKLPEKNCRQDFQCNEMTSLFSCTRGVCRNISASYQCDYELSTDNRRFNTWNQFREDVEIGTEKHWSFADDIFDKKVVECRIKKYCIDIHGMFSCVRGQCVNMKWWSCQRRCPMIDVAEKNVIISSGDLLWVGKCDRIVDLNYQNHQEIHNFKELRDKHHIIMSCTTLDQEEEKKSNDDMINGATAVKAYDCINGTIIYDEDMDRLMEREVHQRMREGTGGSISYNTLMSMYVNRTTLEVIHNTHFFEGNYLPVENQVEIYKRAQLDINNQGCVNTLWGECKTFFEKYGHDGMNGTSPSRFPCFYSPEVKNSVLAFYDTEKTRRMSILFFAIPAFTLLASSTMLYVCSKVLKVNKEGIFEAKLIKKQSLLKLINNPR